MPTPSSTGMSKLNGAQHRLERAHGRGALAPREGGDLAHQVAGTCEREQGFPAIVGHCRDLDATTHDHVQRAGIVALVKEHLAPVVATRDRDRT